MDQIDVLSESKSEKRSEYLPWEDYFMSVTLATAKRGTVAAACHKHAATVVNNRNIIIGTAFEESPSCSGNIPVETKAIRDVQYWTPDCTIYCTRFPHPDSVKAILDGQISKVIYLEAAKDQTSRLDENASRNRLEEGNVKLRHFKPQRKKVEICLQVHQ